MRQQDRDGEAAVLQARLERTEPVERATDVRVEQRVLRALVLTDDRRELRTEDHRDVGYFAATGGATRSLVGFRNDQRNETTTASTVLGLDQVARGRHGLRRRRPAS